MKGKGEKERYTHLNAKFQRPRGMVWGGRREEGSGWETHVYLWQIHFDIWQNQYNIVKLNKIKLKKKEKKGISVVVGVMSLSLFIVQYWYTSVGVAGSC